MVALSNKKKTMQSNYVSYTCLFQTVFYVLSFAINKCSGSFSYSEEIVFKFFDWVKLCFAECSM